MDLKEYREKLGITSKEASLACVISLKTYSKYENDENYGDELKRKGIIFILKEQFEITEEKGILNQKMIKNIVTEVFSNYENKISFCYLFGSYARGDAKDKSDVDLCISTSITGLEYFGLVEDLRVALNKKVDLLRLIDIETNIELINEIMKYGIKIYG